MIRVLKQNKNNGFYKSLTTTEREIAGNKNGNKLQQKILIQLLNKRLTYSASDFVKHPTVSANITV